MSFNPSKLKATVVVTSDTCHKDRSKDKSGEYVVEQLRLINFGDVSKIIVEDDREAIAAVVMQTLDDQANALTITVGGTGLCPRDVTPEATSILYEKVCSGIAAALHATSLRNSPMAALSRLTAGICGSCLIVNFPGKLKACKECFSCLLGFLEHALEQVRYNPEAIKQTHLKLELEEAHDVGVVTNSRGKSSTEEDYITVSHSITENTDSNQDGSNSKPYTSIVHSDKKLMPKKTQKRKPKTIVSEAKRTHSPYPLMNYENVLEIMSDLLHEFKFSTTQIPLDSLENAKQSLGSILANDISSLRVIPPFPVSTMDGYLLNVPQAMLDKISAMKDVEATQLEDFASFEEWQEDPFLKEKFFCCRINTGGRIPTRENRHVAIVPIEDILFLDNNQVSINVIQMKRFIRKTGSDMNEKDVLRARTVIGPPELAIILSMGYLSVKVLQKPTIGLYSSGDELIEPFGEQSCDSRKVLDTNGPLLASLYESKGYKVINFGILKDNPSEISQRITTSLEKCDILVVTGGASMGSGDHMKSVLDSLGAVIHFGRVMMKPGKPAALASLLVGDVRKFVFCLPGNPVSAYITSLVLVLPFLNGAIGNHFGSDSSLGLQSLGNFVEVQLGALTDGDSNDEYVFEGRLEFVRATRMQVEDGYTKTPQQVSVSIQQQSSRLLSLRDCDCLIIINPCLKGSKFLVGQTYPAVMLK